MPKNTVVVRKTAKELHVFLFFWKTSDHNTKTFRMHVCSFVNSAMIVYSKVRKPSKILKELTGSMIFNFIYQFN